ncbi:hypothetical protein CPT_Madawaska_210 [Staphylococcus phage Madawaska]|nr:hypothetical protein CPT_Madawaska_210 [Staphylococcus phage Madawaska]
MSNVLLKEYEGNIDKFLSDKNKYNQAKRYMVSYIERNTKQLSYNTPIYRIPFNMQGIDVTTIMKLVDIDPREMEREIKKLPLTRKYADVLKHPFYVTMSLIIRGINKKLKVKKNDKNLNNDLRLFLLYLSLSFYWSIQVKQFPYEPNENVAQYTINRLSNKFFFKKYKTVSTSITVTAEQNNINSLSILDKGQDDDILVYLMDLRTRLNNLVKNFAKELYKDINAGNYLNPHVDVLDDESNYREGTNISGTVSNISQKTLSEFTQKDINMRILKISCSMTNTNSNIMRNTMSDIRQNEIKNVNNLLLNILTVYLDGKNNPIQSIGSQRFIRESISFFTKSNTKDKRLLENKKILNDFLTKYNSKYNQTEREATKNSYRKTIYVYFVLLISNSY